ncbi:MAG: hypothetical protein JXM68_00615, partial [Sedimentisphaerales bacterium]|nr:hypothetical protein [Sedimentisphaerales bacterium]
DLLTIRMWGILFIPQVWYAAVSLYRQESFIYWNDGSALTDSVLLPCSFYLIALTAISIYLLFFGQAAARLLGFLMDKWPTQFRITPIAYLLRIYGLNLLTTCIISIIQMMMMQCCVNNLNTSDNYSLNLIIPMFLLYLVLPLYLVFKGEKLFLLLNKLTPDHSSPGLITIRCYGIYLFFSITIIILNAMLSYIFLSDHNRFMLFGGVILNFNFGWQLALCAYFLFGGMIAARQLEQSMTRWHIVVRDYAGAFFIRLLGLAIFLSQIKAFILMLYAIIKNGTAGEFLKLYHIDAWLNLSCGNQLLSITLHLALAWYLWHNGNYLLTIIQRKKTY